MSRIRSIKPGFFKSEDVSALPLRARLTWIGLWTHCDDAGRTKDNVKLIKADVWPLDDVSLRDVEDDLSTLAAHGRIVRYEVGGQRYLEITNWRDHQRIDKPSPSRLPPAPETTTINSTNGPGTLPDTSGSPPAGKGGERKGGEGRGRVRARETPPPATPDTDPPTPEPPPRCAEHLDNPNPPPCGPCADARRNHATWDADRNTRIDNAPKCRRHRGQLAHNCAPCRSEHLGADP
jgi:hypothetical protein